MRRIPHLSDLHFGRVLRPKLLDPPVDAINTAAPDLVAISGDLTQRIRSWQFAEGRRFLDRLAPRCLVVPGDHDVPLDNLAVRLFNPFGRYRWAVADDLEPSFQDDEMFVVGLNTVDPHAWRCGRITRGAIRWAWVCFKSRVASEFRVLVAHHPFEQAAESGKALMRGASRSICAIVDCGADIVLSGHLHARRVWPFDVRRGAKGAILQIQAGAGLSTSLRGGEIDFSILTLERGRVEVRRFVARLNAASYEPATRERFAPSDRGWSRIAIGDKPSSPGSLESSGAST